MERIINYEIIKDNKIISINTCPMLCFNMIRFAIGCNFDYINIFYKGQLFKYYNTAATFDPLIGIDKEEHDNLVAMLNYVR